MSRELKCGIESSTKIDLYWLCKLWNTVGETRTQRDITSMLHGVIMLTYLGDCSFTSELIFLHDISYIKETMQ